LALLARPQAQPSVTEDAAASDEDCSLGTSSTRSSMCIESDSDDRCDRDEEDNACQHDCGSDEEDKEESCAQTEAEKSHFQSQRVIR